MQWAWRSRGRGRIGQVGPLNPVLSSIVVAVERDREALLPGRVARARWALRGHGRRREGGVADSYADMVVVVPLRLIVHICLVDQRDAVAGVGDDELGVGLEVVDGAAGLRLFHAIIQ